MQNCRKMSGRVDKEEKMSLQLGKGDIAVGKR